MYTHRTDYYKKYIYTSKKCIQNVYWLYYLFLKTKVSQQATYQIVSLNIRKLANTFPASKVGIGFFIENSYKVRAPNSNGSHWFVALYNKETYNCRIYHTLSSEWLTSLHSTLFLDFFATYYQLVKSVIASGIL